VLEDTKSTMLPTRASGSAHFVPSQVEIESKIESGPSYLRFKSINPGDFNTGFIGSTSTALPLDPRGDVRGGRKRDVRLFLRALL